MGRPSLEGRIGPERRHHRLQGEPNPEHARHSGLRIEVEVHLHRTGRLHHLQSERPLLRHVGPHDRVAVLGHPRHLRARPLRMMPETEEPDVHLAGDHLDLLQVLADLVAGLVDGHHGGTGQLELSGGLESDGPPVRLRERDRESLLHNRFPAEACEALEERPDSARALVRQRPQVLQPIGELLVLGADPPPLPGLAPLLHVFNQRRLAGDRLGGLAAALGHGRLSRSSMPYQRCGRERVRSRQSPTRACQQASAASAAVSARSTRGPSATTLTKGSLQSASTSSPANPPSGPLRTAHGSAAPGLSGQDLSDRGARPSFVQKEESTSPWPAVDEAL